MSGPMRMEINTKILSDVVVFTKYAVANGETDDKNALRAIKDRQTKKSEDGKVDAIKERYADNAPKDATPKDMKAKYSKPTPKSTDQKVADIKSDFKNKEKEKANKPFKTNIKMFKNK